jgi:hypothetical protein
MAAELDAVNADRLLRALAAARGWIERGTSGYRIAAWDGPRKYGGIDARWIAEGLRQGWLAPGQMEGRTVLLLTAAGKRQAHGADVESESESGKQVLETKLVGVAGGEAVYATVNVAESPLAWLRSRAGGLALTRAEFDAGERLRDDYTLAQMSPRVTADWSKPLTDRYSGNSGEAVSHSALAARERVRKALSSVGPGLSDVLLSVCCFLQGLEESEKRLQWPRRSAKLVLKFALQRLAAHYGLARSGGEAA